VLAEEQTLKFLI